MKSAGERDLFLEMQTMKEIIDSTMEMIISRYHTHPSYPYIDLKIDAITGDDYFDTDGMRNSKHIYSWIQGRGLEAISMHVRWYDSFSGYTHPHRKELLTIAKSVATSLMTFLEAHGGHLNFLLNETIDNDHRFTMSDLFCFRGLYAYYSLNGPNDKARKAKTLLLDVIHAVIEGNFYNDQKGFDDSQYKIYEDERVSYASYMIALGALNLLAQLDKDVRIPYLAKQLISYVLHIHVNSKKKWPLLKEDTIVEWIDNSGNPAMDDSVIPLDPGHALEWIGLTSQLLISLTTHYSLDKEMKKWMSSVVSQLPSLLEVNFLLGYSSPGGFLKSVDGIRGAPLADSLPWWSLPETMRALILVDSLCGYDERRNTWFHDCFSSFLEFFCEPSAIPIAIQTINTKGEAIAVIPATPDLDPGYHTGLSLISCYEELSRTVPFIYSGSEVEIETNTGSILSGHVARSTPSTKILDALHLRLALLQSPHEKIVLISIDVLELSKEWIDSIKPYISSILTIEESHILLCATHTHTALSTISLGALNQNDDFLRQLKEDVLHGCYEMLITKEEVVMEIASLQHTIGINRRIFDKERNKTIMRPNEDGSRDDEISIVALRNNDGLIRSVWVNMAVHPTTLGVSMAVVSADYPGRIARVIQEEFGKDVVVIPFTGACGDVRPRILTTDKRNFREGTEKDIEEIGIHIGGEIVHTLKEHTQVVPTPHHGVSINFKKCMVPLKMVDIPTKEELISLIESNNERLKKALLVQEHLDDFTKKHDNPLFDVQMELSWATRLLELEVIPEAVEGEFSVVSFNDEVYIFNIPGELFSSVGKKLKQLVKDKFPIICGYSGGSLGYLPSNTSFKEGGYEIDQAYKYYGLAGHFCNNLEDLIISTYTSLLKEIQHE